MTIYIEHENASREELNINWLYPIEMPYVPRIGDTIYITEEQKSDWYARLSKDHKAIETIFNGEYCETEDLGAVVSNVAFDCASNKIICTLVSGVIPPEWVGFYLKKVIEDTESGIPYNYATIKHEMANARRWAKK